MCPEQEDEPDKFVGKYNVDKLYFLLRYARKSEGFWDDMPGHLPSEDDAELILKLLVEHENKTKGVGG